MNYAITKTVSLRHGCSGQNDGCVITRTLKTTRLRPSVHMLSLTLMHIGFSHMPMCYFYFLFFWVIQTPRLLMRHNVASREEQEEGVCVCEVSLSCVSVNMLIIVS